jgi:hypothetical protein
MPKSNGEKINLVIADINERIKRENDIIGVNTTSSLQGRIDLTNDLIAGYDPAIQGIDNKIVSIGQSINQLKDEIITLITDAVGVSTVNTCGIASTGPFGICTSWSGGISTCLVGYAPEYYDSIGASGWAFSSTSTNPFTATSTVYLSSASNTFGVGVGTFLTHAQNNSSYSAGARVSLASSATCAATQTEIDRKDGEIADLRSDLGHYIGVVNSLREQRWKSELERWGIIRAQQESQAEKDRLSGVLTAFTDSTYNRHFLR